MSHDYLIVGAGPYGLVFAERIANVLGQSVLVIDKRDHIGGNCFSTIDQETDIEYHAYGTHIFHTSSEKIWKYINQFSEFNSYFHQVLTTHENNVYQMPINLETINQFYHLNLRPFEVETFLQQEKNKESYLHPKNLEEKVINLIGRPLYEAFIRGYTFKQWGKDPRQLPENIIQRLPIRANYNECYFHHARWQGIPLNGYTQMFQEMCTSPLIEIKTGVDFFSIKNQLPLHRYKKIIYSGPIDAYFAYEFGKLEWRSISLEKKVLPYTDYQGTSVMNFADMDVDYTRIHEPRHLHDERKYPEGKTLIFYERSLIDLNQPYYPIQDAKNQRLFQLYQEKSQLEKNVIFGGRLGSYRYFDMDQVIGQALKDFTQMNLHLHNTLKDEYATASNI